MDHITITDLRLHLPHGLSPSQSAFALDPPPACPVLFNLRIDMHDGIVQGDDDTMLGLGVNYSSVVKDIYQLFSAVQQAGAEKRWKGHRELMRDVAAIPLALEAVKGVKVELVLERAALYAESVAYVAYFDADQRGEQEGQQGQGQGQGEGSRNASMRREMSSVECRDIKVICVVGLHPYERRERQRLELDLKVQPDLEGLDTKALIGAAVEYVEQSNFGTIESLSHTLAERLLPLLGTPATPVSLTVAIRKPSANPWSVPGITITRSTPDISASAAPSASSTAPSTSTATTTSIQASSHSSSSSSRSRVFLALGSNIEPRLPHLLRAIRSLQSSGCTLISTGKLYESEPMYHTDQSRFLNSAIEVQTTLEPMELLKLLKKVEREVGREKTFENGPRVVDVDLIYYGGRVENVGKKGDEEVQGVGWLEVPHWGRREREFVLRPLCDIYPTFIDPILRIPLATLLARLPSYPPQLAPVIPFHPPSSLLRLEPSSSPAIMAIFNATPDSFSDGSSSRLDVQSCLAEVSSLFDQPHPPAILDIGGMSTRPGSEPCSEAEELERVVPLIQAIRTSGRLCANIPISVDTYRPAVARAAVQAGASSINDVRGGREEGMLKTMAELDVPVFLMHSRGDSSSMTTPSAQNYAPLGVVEGVRREMVTMVRKALTAGVKRWNIILDPGLGFAKSPQDSLVLLKEIDKLTAKGTELYGLPVLVGASRKGFVGKAIGRETPLERGYGDAAVASWCVAKGVDVLRVHDVRAAGDVLAMTRAISQA